MKRLQFLCIFLAVLSFTSGVGPAYAQAEPTGSKDHPLFPRLPNYLITTYEEKEVDSKTFAIGNGQSKKIEGHTFVISYEIKRNYPPVSSLLIAKHFADAAREAGGVVFIERPDKTTVKLIHEGKEIWAQITSSGGGIGYKLTIAEIPVTN